MKAGSPHELKKIKMTMNYFLEKTNFTRLKDYESNFPTFYLVSRYLEERKEKNPVEKKLKNNYALYK